MREKKKSSGKLSGRGNVQQDVESMRVPDWVLPFFFKTKGHTSAATWQGVIGIPRLGRTGVSRTR